MKPGNYQYNYLTIHRSISDYTAIHVLIFHTLESEFLRKSFDMKFDDLLREVGEFGRYQKWVYFWSCLPAVSVGGFMLLNVIVFGVPDHR